MSPQTLKYSSLTPSKTRFWDAFLEAVRSWDGVGIGGAGVGWRAVPDNPGINDGGMAALVAGTRRVSGFLNTGCAAADDPGNPEGGELTAGQIASLPYTISRAVGGTKTPLRSL